ncbi:MAG: hypothetical protein HY887_10255 [Deltaproteobacteria bacterium]|nr:hypothetical protein [Deltaproteobacteria bacterium]
MATETKQTEAAPQSQGEARHGGGGAAYLSAARPASLIDRFISTAGDNLGLLTAAFLILFALLIYHRWFSEGVIARTDLFLPSDEWISDHAGMPQIWNEEGGGHVLAIYEAHAHLNWLWAALHQRAGLTIDAGRRLLWFLPFFTGLFSMYVLGRAFYKTRTAGIVSSVYFMASNMTVWAAHASWIQGIAGLGIAPLVILFFIKGSTGRSALNLARHALSGGILLSIIVWYDMKVALMAYAFITGLAVFMFFAPDRERGKPGFSGLADKVWRPAVILAVLAVLPVILSLHTVLPHLLSGGTSGAPAEASQPAYLNVSGSNNILYALLLTYSAIAENQQASPLFLGIISALAFSALILRGRCLWTIYLTLAGVVLILLSNHTSGPLGWLVFFLYEHVPGYIAFRDPTKFLLFLTLPVALLLGATASEITRIFSENAAAARLFDALRLRRRHHRIVVQTAAVSFFAAVSVFAALPFFTGKGITIDKDRAGSALKPRGIPEEYSLLYGRIAEGGKGYKTLLFPGKIPFATTSADHPSVYGNYYNQPPFLEFSRYLWVSANGHKGVLWRSANENLGKLLGLLNIQNIAVAPASEPMWGILPNEGRDNIINALDKERGLSKDYAGSAEGLALYKNTQALPLVYGATNAVYVAGGLDTFLKANALDVVFHDWAFFFASQLQDSGIEALEASDAVVLNNRGIQDIALSAVDAKYRLDAWDGAAYASSGVPADQRQYDSYKNRPAGEGWLRLFYPYWTSFLGEFAESKKGLVQAEGVGPDKPLRLGFNAPKDGRYEIWVRAGVNMGAATGDAGLPVYLDNALLDFLNTGAGGGAALRWLRLQDAVLTQGEHTITVFNRGAATALDQFAAVPFDEMQRLRGRISEIVSKKKIILLSAAGMDDAALSDWERDGSPDGLEVLKSYKQFAGLETQVEIPFDAKWSFAFRVSAMLPHNSGVIAAIDGMRTSLLEGAMRRHEGADARYWIKTEPVELSAGRHRVVLHKAGRGVLKVGMVAATNSKGPVEEFFKTNGRNPLNWRKRSPSGYTIDRGPTGGRFIVFNNNFHPGWNLSYGGKSLRPYPVNGWANGFILEGAPDNKEMSISFAMQEYAQKGFYLSTVLLLAAAGFVLITAVFRGRG